MASPAHERELRRARAERAWVEFLLRAGHPDLEGLLLALNDWAAEEALIREEGENETEILSGEEATADRG